MKKILTLIVFLFVIVVFNSCVYYVYPDKAYYQDYEDAESSASYNYYYSYNYSPPQYAGYYPTPTFTPVPVATTVVINNTEINIIVLKVVENKHIFYHNNKEIAVWIFYPDGRVERKGQYINGKVIRYYDNSNTVEWEFEYKNNLRWGPCKRYYNNGKLWEEVYYNQGKREGLCKIYHPDEKIKEEVKYKNGQRYGEYKIYYEDGKLIEYGNYKNNNKEIKFRDEKYFKNIKDKQTEAAIISTQVIKQEPTPTPVVMQFPQNGLLKPKNTPIATVVNKDNIKEVEQGGMQKDFEQQQKLIEQKIITEQITDTAKTEEKDIKIKKQKVKKHKKMIFTVNEQIKDKKVEKADTPADVTDKVKDELKDSINDRGKDNDKIQENENEENSDKQKNLKTKHKNSKKDDNRD